MIVQSIGNVSFKMKEICDFTFLDNYGQVFCVFAQNDSGNISFGVANGKDKYFIKIAGAKTSESRQKPQEVVNALKQAAPLYKNLMHPNLIQLIEEFVHDDLYVLVFKWTEGDCLFDYWNFEMYAKNPEIVSPKERFRLLSCEKKLKAFNAIFDFLVYTESTGYVAVDFYDGSIMYDFHRDVVMICDIDFFRKCPSINNMGENFWGTKRLKSPEEYIEGAQIDNITNVFTLGALLMSFFGSFANDEIGKMYKENTFFPCRYETWELSEALYKIALKAVNPDRKNRYGAMAAFYDAWNAGV